ncbi:MAG: ROK family protein [Jatrophihabitans sp.]|uniref:ROK family protein n=1 Tax=Jatrophihabitans sp. TaxID=1932789 RepID=UPI003F81D274
MTGAGDGDVVAVDVGGTTIKGARVAADGTVLQVLDVPTPQGDEAVRAVVKLVAELRSPGTAAVGVVTPGTVDEASGVVRRAVNLGWTDVPLRAVLADETALPVGTGHDVTWAARAEHAARPRPDLFFVALGTGIAAAHLVDGEPRRGASGAAGELGHIVVRPDGEPCTCGGRGCLETLASGRAIVQRSGLDAATLLAGGAAPVWDDATAALGDALATATALLDPGVIVLGGGLADAGVRLLEPVRARLASALPWRPAPPVVLGVLGPRVGVHGAAILARSTAMISGKPGSGPGFPRDHRVGGAA